MDLVVRPWEPATLALVEQVLEERRIARDEKPVARSEVGQRREQLVDVGSDRLDDAVAGHAKAHVHARRPGTHRERVERHERTRPECVAREERDVAMGDLAFAPATDPVGGVPVEPLDSSIVVPGYGTLPPTQRSIKPYTSM